MTSNVIRHLAQVTDGTVKQTLLSVISGTDKSVCPALSGLLQANPTCDVRAGVPASLWQAIRRYGLPQGTKPNVRFGTILGMLMTGIWLPLLSLRTSSST
jgi:hypothetical protein